MPLLNSHTELPESFFEIEGAAYDLFGIEIEDQDVWTLARKSENIPHMGNIRASLLFEALKNKLMRINPALEIRVYINSVDTRFVVNNEVIIDKEDLQEARHAYLESPPCLTEVTAEKDKPAPKGQDLIYAINNNGDLIGYCNSAEKAEKRISKLDDEDQRLISVIPMTEDKFQALSAIQCFFTKESDRVDLQKAIEQSDDRDFIYAQLAEVKDDYWIYEKYIKHVKHYLLHRGQEFHSVDMLSFDEHCDKLRQDIDFIQDYDRALSNAGMKRA